MSFDLPSFASLHRASGALVAGLLLLCLTLTARSVVAADTPKRLNIVLIMADDLGYGELGCYGQKRIKTPRLDQMAKEGLRFTQFYAGSPVCAPSRCVLMTGKHAGHAAVRDNRERKPEGQYPLPAAEITLAEVLKGQGYTTAAIGKWGLGAYDNSGSPLKQGFDHFFGFLCQRQAHNHFPAFLWHDEKKRDLFDEEVTKKNFIPAVAPGFDAFEKFGSTYDGDLFEEEALEFLRQNKAKPFFLYVPLTSPHLALQVPDDSLREYEDKWDDPPYEGKKGYTPHDTPRAAYAAMITRLDRTVGRILDELKELELEGNTLVLFTSDNGPAAQGDGGADTDFFMSSGPLRNGKGSAYEGGIRVPCLARWPGKIEAGRESPLPLAFYDVLPTLCDLTDASYPDHLDGISFAPLLLGHAGQQAHDFLYWEFAGYTGYQALRFGDWKAIRPALKKGVAEIELYNLATDLGESTNVAAKHPELVEKADAIMAAQHVKSAEFPLPAIDVEPKGQM
jgi:arylsulfatase